MERRTKLSFNNLAMKNNQDSWEKEFDEKFLVVGSKREDWPNGCWNVGATDINIKSFINSLLSHHQSSLVEEVEKKVPEATESDGWDIVMAKNRCCPGDDVAEGYNVARRKILSLLSSYKLK